MEEWMPDDDLAWDEEDGYQLLIYLATEELAGQVFLSDNEYRPKDGDEYNLGHLEPTAWWPLVNQLDEMVDLEAVVDMLAALDSLLVLPGIPTEVLEAPLRFLESVLEGDLPLDRSGRKVGSRHLVRIALAVTHLLREFPEAAQAAVRAWADVHRATKHPFSFKDFEREDLEQFLSATDLPPAVTGFSMMLTMTLMRWPERAEGMSLPPAFLEPELYSELSSQWEVLPDSPTVTEEGTGEAEALFAQGQLAHLLAQLNKVEGLDHERLEDEETALTYSRLSRAILWTHNQCRHCSERTGVTCRAARRGSERPVPLVDVAGEMASTGRIEGCIRMFGSANRGSQRAE